MERAPVFGKIQFMNYAGCKRKFKVATFVAQYPGASENRQCDPKHSLTARVKSEKRRPVVDQEREKPKT
jgi:hypothetical protein